MESIKGAEPEAAVIKSETLRTSCAAAMMDGCLVPVGRVICKADQQQEEEEEEEDHRGYLTCSHYLCVTLAVPSRLTMLTILPAI
ncbi:hypothetical protein E2C01_100768 [Portunus trituberculatus]|uniref:Uncharacterized protein n=1 Tax=Portunus trituberculatus TaxID=210409 RepID=A0A5B7KEF7_PORTR|nr:hypothetical protein [Portunus trituberculatus]